MKTVVPPRFVGIDGRTKDVEEILSPNFEKPGARLVFACGDAMTTTRNTQHATQRTS